MGFLGKLLGKDRSLELKDVMLNLELLAEAEAHISSFYRLCAGAMTEEKDLWNFLADQELQHADKVKDMLGLIAGKPQMYRPGISFSTVTIKLFVVQMQRLAEQMDQGLIPPAQLYEIALEIEDSAVELSYSRIVKTEDEAFKSLAHQIDSESAEHKSAISAKMKAPSAR